MNEPILLTIDGEVEHPQKLTHSQLSAIEASQQIDDVSRLAPGRSGRAVRLQGILDLAKPNNSADYIGLHASNDDFHASVPLGGIQDKAIVIYERDGQPLELKAGGPFRFFIPDHAACQLDEIDECANVKFIDRIELTAGKGYDNRPQDEDEHEELHRRQEG